MQHPSVRSAEQAYEEAILRVGNLRHRRLILEAIIREHEEDICECEAQIAQLVEELNHWKANGTR